MIEGRGFLEDVGVATAGRLGESASGSQGIRTGDSAAGFLGATYAALVARGETVRRAGSGLQQQPGDQRFCRWIM